MADKRISQLNPHTSPSDSDLLVIVNNNETKKITYADLKDSIVINSDNTILNEFSASYLIDSASFDERIIAATNEQDLSYLVNTSSFNDLSSSVHVEIIAATNEQSFNGLISGSSQLTSSYDSRYILSGSLTQTTWDNISGKPEGLVSESTDLTLLNSFTQSIDSRVSILEELTSSYETTGRGILSGSISYNSLTDIPNGIISQSVDIADFVFTTDTITNSSITLHATDSDIILNADGNVYKGSASAGNGLVTDGYLGIIIGDENRINTGTGHSITDNLDGVTNYINQFTQSYQTDSSSFDSKILTEKGRIDAILSASTADADTFAEIVTLINSVDLTNDNAFASYYTSSNARITSLENNTGSYETTGRGIVSSSAQITPLLPSGIVSGSSQVLGGSNVYSSSAQLPNGLISGSSQLTASYDTRYTLSGSIQNIVLPSDLISSSAQIEALGFITGVLDIDNYVTTSSYNTDSASFDNRITSLVSAGVPSGTISGSSQLTASFDTRYTLSGSVQSITLPSDLISSSAQITAYGFISESTDLTSLNSFTSSYFTDSSSLNTKVNDLINHTSSYETTGRGIISESVVTISDTQPSTGVGNLWYDSNGGNLYLHYDTNTWIDTSNGVIQTIINDGSLLSTASFNAWTASYTASVPAGTISSSNQLNTTFEQIASGTHTLVSGSSQILGGSGVWSGSSQLPSGLISGSSQITGFETTGRGIISSSTQLSTLGYVTSGGNVTFNSVTANQYIVSSSVYYVTQSYSSGSTIFGNTADDTHQFTGSVSISGSLTASLTNGYFWVGNSLNKTYEVPTSSFVSTTTFNALSQSANTTDIQVSSSLASLQASLGSTSTAFSFIGATNPTNLQLVSYLTSSFNGGVIDILAVNNGNGTATSTNYQFASYGTNVGISQNGKQTSGAGAPNLAPSISVSGSYVIITVSLTGTYNIKGVARLF